MLERPAKGSGASMRVKSLLILLSVTALGAYAVGRHSSPVNNAPVAQPQPSAAKPLALAALYHLLLQRLRPQTLLSIRSTPPPRRHPRSLRSPAPPRSLHRLRYSARLRSH